MTRNGATRSALACVVLLAGCAGDELVEVLRFEGSEKWSVRRLAARPSNGG